MSFEWDIIRSLNSGKSESKLLKLGLNSTT
jgi:hypothetical protein